MPQANLNLIAQNPTRGAQALQTDTVGSLLTGSGQLTHFNITTATVIKTGPGRVAKVSVLIAGSAVGSVNDIGTTGGAAVANQLAVIPETVGVLSVDMPFTTGLVITPGTGQTLAVSYT